VVDDEPDSRDFVAFVLEQSGAIVTRAASGSQAFQQIEQSAFDLIISDIGMPEMDGYQLMQQVRSLAQQVPAIALTAYAGEYDRQQALEVGFQEHLAKPVEPEALVKAIGVLVGDLQESKTPVRSIDLSAP
jgi:CheY-like chemotaxis protein